MSRCGRQDVGASQRQQLVDSELVIAARGVKKLFEQLVAVGTSAADTQVQPIPVDAFEAFTKDVSGRVDSGSRLVQAVQQQRKVPLTFSPARIRRRLEDLAVQPLLVAR